jgi:outer membrane receptor for Fe3+-dicitrate
VSAINVRRHANVKESLVANTTAVPTDVTYDNWSLAPRIGVRYPFNPNLQVFANVSRSVDSPASREYSGSGHTAPYVRPLVERKANTVEGGIQGCAGIFDGSLALYRSRVKDELLNVQLIGATPNAAVTGAFNATPTIHPGVEAGLNARLWDNDSGEQVYQRQVYTYNDFYYRHDPPFGDNQLPGIPNHVYQAIPRSTYSRLRAPRWITPTVYMRPPTQSSARTWATKRRTRTGRCHWTGKIRRTRNTSPQCSRCTTPKARTPRRCTQVAGSAPTWRWKCATDAGAGAWIQFAPLCLVSC